MKEMNTKKRYLKRGLIIAAGIFIALLLIGIFAPEVPKEAARNRQIKRDSMALQKKMEADIEKSKSDSLEKSGEGRIPAALAAIRAEPKVKDLIWTSASVLYIAVDDDGTRRNGYAEYICQVLHEYGINDTWVKIVKFGSMDDPSRDNAYGILLGESRCDFFSKK